MRNVTMLSLLAALAGGISTARADVTINFAATVTAGIDDANSPVTSLAGFNTGDSVIGAVAYNPTAAAKLTTGQYADYPLDGAALIDGGTTTLFNNSTEDTLLVYNDGSSYDLVVSGYTANGSLGFDITLQPVNAAAYLANGFAIPTSIALGSFNATGTIFETGGSGGELGLNFAPAASGSAVPEPASMLAFATGLLGVALVRRRRV